jgi:hypothetical protein
MYLGSLLALLGLFFATLSLLSLLVCIGFFAFFDRMAAYEERFAEDSGSAICKLSEAGPEVAPSHKKKRLVNDGH